MLVAGTIALGLFILCGAEARGVRLWRNNQEELPLLAPQNDQAVPSAVTSYSPSGTAHPPLGSLDELGESPSSDHHLCNICLDAPKDCFFDPCGHRCTCFTCGQR